MSGNLLTPIPYPLVFARRAPAGPLSGVPVATLQSWLLTAQTAYAELLSGGKVVSASYAQGDGSRSVTYSQASQAGLLSYINQLQAMLGLPRQVRAPMRPVYR